MIKDLTFVCDQKRHLVCIPYSIENLHKMSEVLNIKKCWFHSKKGKSHYDIPKMRIEEITNKCKVVSPKVVMGIINGDITEV